MRETCSLTHKLPFENKSTFFNYIRTSVCFVFTLTLRQLACFFYLRTEITVSPLYFAYDGFDNKKEKSWKIGAKVMALVSEGLSNVTPSNNEAHLYSSLQWIITNFNKKNITFFQLNFLQTFFKRFHVSLATHAFKV